MISFAATQTKVTTSIILSLNARDEDTSSSGTTETLTVSHNSPPKYLNAPTTFREIDSALTSPQDIMLPPRADCVDPEG